VYQALLNKQLEQGKQARLTRTGGVFCASWEWPVLAGYHPCWSSR